MEQKDTFRHRRYDTPAYLIWAGARPATGGKGRSAYITMVADEARKEIARPIDALDIEVEVLYATRQKVDIRADVDNILWPTLDALKGVAYRDDRQVRSVTATIFDLNDNTLVAGRVEYVGRLFYSGRADTVLVCIYSDSRLADLGGEQAVRDERYRDWDRRRRAGG